MGWVVGILVIVLLGLGAVAAWLFVEKNRVQQQAARTGTPLGALALRGLLAAATGGGSAAAGAVAAGAGAS